MFFISRHSCTHISIHRSQIQKMFQKPTVFVTVLYGRQTLNASIKLDSLPIILILTNLIMKMTMSQHRKNELFGIPKRKIRRQILRLLVSIQMNGFRFWFKHSNAGNDISFLVARILFHSGNIISKKQEKSSLMSSQRASTKVWSSRTVSDVLFSQYYTYIARVTQPILILAQWTFA